MDETLSELCERNQRLDMGEVLVHIQKSHEADAEIMIEPEALKEQREANPGLKLLDVRTKEEFEAIHIEGSIHMTAQVGSDTNCVSTAQDLLHQVVDNWNPDELFVIIDHQGQQAPDVATYFLGHGMKQARCLRGGIDAWSLEVDNSVPRYELHKAMESDAQKTNRESSGNSEQQGGKQAKSEDATGQETRPSLLDSLSINSR